MGNGQMGMSGSGVMSRFGAVLTVIALLSVATLAQAPSSTTKIDLGGKLYRAVFISGPGTLASGDLAAVPEPARGRLSTFLIRRSAFSSAYESKPEDADAVQRDAKRRVIERAMVSLIDVPNIETQAVEFVKAAPIAYEWEGRVEGPLAESAYAEDVLKKTPKAAIAPFLYVFVAQRQRAAFEAAERVGDEKSMKETASKYRDFLGRARAASDPIFKLLADDLDQVPFVYTKSEKHPRDYNSAG
jgi:hypothetical protein